jgi:acetyltransferase-like isoleucine patch superfamily enzyme
MNWFIQITKPFIQRLARAYDIRLERPLFPTGKHPIVAPPGAERSIPKSCVFNTRSGSITIGTDVVFGEDVQVLTGKHFSIAEAEATGRPLHYVPESGRDIVIKDGAYIGTMAILIGPVTIGEHAVVGAGSVVTKDVPPRTFVAGVPARIVRQLA